MNNDFTLPATPRAARHIMRMARLCDLDLDDRVRDLAEQDKLSDEIVKTLPKPEAGISSAQRALLDFVLDYGWRCIIPTLHSTMNRDALMVALSLPDAPRPITVATPNIQPWIEQRARYGLSREEMCIQNPVDCAEHNYQKGRRDGVLVIEWGQDPNAVPTTPVLNGLAREWSKTLLWGDPRVNPDVAQNGWQRQGHSSWPDFGIRQMVKTMWPEMPSRYLIPTPAIQMELRSMGYVRTRPHDVAFMFGIFVPPPDPIAP